MCICNSCHAIYEIAEWTSGHGRVWNGRSNRIGGASKTKAYDFARLVQMRFNCAREWVFVSLCTPWVVCNNSQNNKQRR